MKQPLWIFLAAFALSISSAANGTPGDILVTREDRVDVYEAPSYASQILITMEEGRKLKELRREGLWIKVLIYGEIGKDGWVHGSHVAPQSAGAILAAVPGISAGEPDAPAEISPGSQFDLVITGTPEQQFRVRCKSVGQDRATKRASFVGRIPNTYAIEGREVSCRVSRLARYAGWLRAELHDPGLSKSIGAAQTSAKDGCVSVRTKGRWGKARSIGKCDRDRANW